ncbi:hypothetical protein N836_07970 [Leptolyngbya sp. Heron Island J]|uniref:hypothetical protein n=1 Tax=Leptolyngbya sp. Heron Island J TaxID=1385935 RepID=UPI0003B95431|nr:hypothetical protein [Leptolyngbya sp. Heron Island J]ESA36269.1 hypothetical protein N836_07970 [Leptolyngbya sp. Heron Island J]
MTKKLVLRLIILLGLILPFLLREVSNSLEPYPAVLQPSGATKISTSEGVLRFYKTELLAIGNDGTEQFLDPRQFFNTIPHQYWTHIARNGFGLSQPKSRSFSVGIWTLSATTILEASPEERIAALDWMKARLIELEMPETEKLRVQQVRTLFDIDKRMIIENEITEQTDVELR